MDAILSRFVSQAPVAVMARAALTRLFEDSILNDLFDRCADEQYTRTLTFSTLYHLMTKVTFRTHESVHAAYRHTVGIPVSLAAVYDKLAHLETGISAALVSETAQSMSDVITALPLQRQEPLPGFRLRTLDGNFLAGTEHRLDCLRASGAAALPGMSLVVQDGRTGLLTNLIPCEDAYTSERSLFPELLALVQPNCGWPTAIFARMIIWTGLPTRKRSS